MPDIGGFDRCDQRKYSLRSVHNCVLSGPWSKRNKHALESQSTLESTSMRKGTSKVGSAMARLWVEVLPVEEERMCAEDGQRLKSHAHMVAQLVHVQPCIDSINSTTVRVYNGCYNSSTHECTCQI